MSFEVFIPSWKVFEALGQFVMDFGSFWEARINVQIVKTMHFPPYIIEKQLWWEVLIKRQNEQKLVF